jgi:hypothetical protein
MMPTSNWSMGRWHYSRRSPSKLSAFDFVGENWVRLAKFGIQGRILREKLVSNTIKTELCPSSKTLGHCGPDLTHTAVAGD